MASRSVAPLGVRIPEGLKNQIKVQAAENRRSLNSEIVTMLERQVQKQIPETQNGSVTA